MKILQVILALSLLVVVHEFGHYLWARIFKIKVEKFYLFFDPFFSLFKYKPKNSDTEFGIGWIPFGGYCKIAGFRCMKCCSYTCNSYYHVSSSNCTHP